VASLSIRTRLILVMNLLVAAVGATVGSLRVGWRVRDNVTLTLGVENVTNEDYRIHGSGLNAPGRNVVFGLEMPF